jgi:hypothetical protein
LKDHYFRPEGLSLSANESLVKIKLETPAELKFIGTKLPNLRDCKCDIPSLQKIKKDNYEPAKSINHAFRLISTDFEPNRRAFGGSVYLNVYYLDADKWIKLETLREDKINSHFLELSKKYLGKLVKRAKEDQGYNQKIREKIKSLLESKNGSESLGSDSGTIAKSIVEVLNDKYKFSVEEISEMLPFLVHLVEDSETRKINEEI